MASNRHAANDNLSIEYVRSRLRYEAETGLLYWLPIPSLTRHDKTWNARHADKVAGYTDHRGYVFVRLMGTLYLAHRLAWLLHYGAWPSLDVDHENRVASDNRIANLRLATISENCRNTTIRSNNTSGFKGVHMDSKSGKWTTLISIDGRVTYVGQYETAEIAAEAYRLAASEHYGDFASTGR
jgi:hypothetical protein